MLFKDSAIYILSKIIPGALGFALTISLSWLLSPADYGMYGYGMAIAMMISMIGFDWLGLSFMRFYQKEANNPIFMPTVSIIFMGLCAITGVFLALFGLSGNKSFLLLIICTVGTWCYSYFELTGRITIARFQSSRYFWMNLIRNTIILLLSISAAYFYKSPLMVLGVGFVAMFATALLFWRMPLRPSAFDFVMMRRILVYGWPLFMTLSLFSLLNNFSRVILENLAGPAEVGYFTAAAMLASSTIGIIGAGIGAATYSMAVRMLDLGHRDQLPSQLERNFTLLISLLVPSAVGLSILAHPIAQLCFPHDYVDRVTALLPWMALVTVINTIRANYIDHGFQLGQRTSLLIWSIAIPAVTSIVLNILFIPYYGGLGSAYALTIAYILNAIIAIILVRRAYSMPIPLGAVMKVGAATGIMTVSLWPLRSLPVGMLGLVVMTGIMAFAGGLLIFNVLGCRKFLLCWLARRFSS